MVSQSPFKLRMGELEIIFDIFDVQGKTLF